jgi:hypothetical protein
LAIVSFVLSMLWVFGFGSALAVVFALVALSKINASNGEQDGRGLAFAGLVIGICGLIGAVGFVLILSTPGISRVVSRSPSTTSPPVTVPATTTPPPASTTQPLTTLPPATPPSAVNPLGTTLTVEDPTDPGGGLSKVLVQDVAYPVPIGLLSFAIASVGVCAGPEGSQTGPSSNGFTLVDGDQDIHASPDAIPSLGPGSCTDAELYFEIPTGSSPTSVAYGPYRWLVPAR